MADPVLRRFLLYRVNSHRGAFLKGGENGCGFFCRCRDQANPFKRAAQTGHLLRQIELNEFLDSRNRADVFALHVEIERT